RADVVIRELFGDVRRRVLDEHRVARADGGDEAAAERAAHDVAVERRAVGAKVHAGTGGLGGGQEVSRREGGGGAARALGGVAAQGRGGGKAADGEIAERGVGRRADRQLDLGAERLGDGAGGSSSERRKRRGHRLAD